MCGHKSIYEYTYIALNIIYYLYLHFSEIFFKHVLNYVLN